MENKQIREEHKLDKESNGQQCIRDVVLKNECSMVHNMLKHYVHLVNTDIF